MATLVMLHAHPDDEAISTGGTMARAVEEGHRVVLVVATGGELGEVAEDVLEASEALGDRRRDEVTAAAAELGAQRVELLGYRDSGMMGEASNADPACFWQADVDEAAVRLAAICREERADVLTCYDDHGGYGHPDHIQVHRVGHRAAELAGVAEVYEATMDRDHLGALVRRARAAGDGPPEDGSSPELDEATFGTPAAQITTVVDVTAQLDKKRAAMRAHASQIPADSFFLRLDDDSFAEAFGAEWFIRSRGHGDGPAGALW